MEDQATYHHNLPPLIYIAGPITDLPMENVVENFSTAESYLTGLGFRVVNPLSLNHHHDKSWSSYMRVCIAELCRADAIFLMKDWYESRGAVMEEEIAKSLNMKRISWTTEEKFLHQYVKEFIQKTAP